MANKTKNNLEHDAEVAEAQEAEAKRDEGAQPPVTPATTDEGGDATEVDILRSELAKLQEELSETAQQAADLRDKYLRARADLENYRRRVAQDLERAREAGLDSAVLTVLTVYDDLGRALTAASEGEPSSIIAGIEAVREGLKRNLEALGIKEVGAPGETFDPDFHEALTSLPTDDESLAGKIAEVYQPGFVKHDRLVRPARVVVYQD